jgi:hypothetical protein
MGDIVRLSDKRLQSMLDALDQAEQISLHDFLDALHAALAAHADLGRLEGLWRDRADLRDQMTLGWFAGFLHRVRIVGAGQVAGDPTSLPGGDPSAPTGPDSPGADGDEDGYGAGPGLDWFYPSFRCVEAAEDGGRYWFFRPGWDWRDELEKFFPDSKDDPAFVIAEYHKAIFRCDRPASWIVAQIRDHDPSSNGPVLRGCLVETESVTVEEPRAIALLEEMAEACFADGMLRRDPFVIENFEPLVPAGDEAAMAERVRAVLRFIFGQDTSIAAEPELAPLRAAPHVPVSLLRALVAQLIWRGVGGGGDLGANLAVLQALIRHASLHDDRAAVLALRFLEHIAWMALRSGTGTGEPAHARLLETIRLVHRHYSRSRVQSCGGNSPISEFWSLASYTSLLAAVGEDQPLDDLTLLLASVSFGLDPYAPPSFDQVGLPLFDCAMQEGMPELACASLSLYVFCTAFQESGRFSDWPAVAARLTRAAGLPQFRMIERCLVAASSIVERTGNRLQVLRLRSFVSPGAYRPDGTLEQAAAALGSVMSRAETSLRERVGEECWDRLRDPTRQQLQRAEAKWLLAGTPGGSSIEHWDDIVLLYMKAIESLVLPSLREVYSRTFEIWKNKGDRKKTHPCLGSVIQMFQSHAKAPRRETEEALNGIGISYNVMQYVLLPYFNGFWPLRKHKAHFNVDSKSREECDLVRARVLETKSLMAVLKLFSADKRA